MAANTLEQGFPLSDQIFVDTSTGEITYAWRQLLVTLWNRTGGAGGGGLTELGLMQSLAGTYGALEDGVTDDVAAIDDWLVDPSSKVVWIENTVFTSNGMDEISKRGMGPGNYHFSNGKWAPAWFVSIQTLPQQGTGSDLNYYFSGDLSKDIRASYTILGSATNNIRKSPTQRYFESVTTPVFDVLHSFSGWSGVTCRTVGSTSIGATSVSINSAAGVVTGDLMCWFDANGLVQEQRNVLVTGTTLSWSGGLTHAYAALSPLAQGPRTMNALFYHESQAGSSAGGDTYDIVTRIINSYVPLAGQEHFFETATCGYYGGDATYTTSGTYVTGLEMQYVDTGHDVAAIASVQSFNRTNNTGARSVVWIGDYYQVIGGVAIDAFALYVGPSRIGIDMSRADFSSNAQAAMQLSAAQRVYFMAETVASGPGYDPRGIYPPFTSNDPGVIYIEGNTDGTSDYLALWNNTARVRLRPTALQVNVDIQVAANLGCQNLAVGSAGQMQFGAGSGNYFTFTAGQPMVVIGGTPHTITYT